ncbi:conjugative transposon protein TraM [Olivibacter sp. 47]|jgi:conjugative transposon TraM protein|uniref:conjugative transposon protein TraM n=1 Tax=Olivibacter sp. 47 TaxID=3056486 RepID=UPI0025A38792|nr:conjugative transposon protein TraM [Olivibacter sp. 47]MDM8176003.1 conjugative transposon protein TraM [Olivibacter sp. 47]
MENQDKNSFLRERRFMTALPILALPFLTLMFWVLGGGSAAEIAAGQPDAKSGLNPDLPAAKLKDKQLDKFSYYQQAEADSAKLNQQQRRDPYYNENNSTDESATTGKTGYYRAPLGTPYPTGDGYSASERKVYDKLAKLDRTLNTPDPMVTASAQPPKESALAPHDVDRLEGLLEKMQSDSNTEDPEMGELNSMMETILDIQHPERVQQRLVEKSVQNRGKVYPVLAAGRNASVTLLGRSNGKLPDSVVARSQGGFYSMESVQERKEQNAIRAVIHEDQTIVSGSTVKFRLIDEVVINGVQVPKNTFVFGEAALSGERLNCTIKSISYGNSIFPVNLEVFGADGMNGIHIHGAISRDVSRQSGERAVQGVGMTGIGTSLETQAMGAAIEGSKSLFTKKLKLIEVDLKAGDIVLLKDREQKD